MKQTPRSNGDEDPRKVQTRAITTFISGSCVIFFAATYYWFKIGYPERGYAFGLLFVLFLGAFVYNSVKLLKK